MADITGSILQLRGAQQSSLVLVPQLKLVKTDLLSIISDLESTLKDCVLDQVAIRNELKTCNPEYDVLEKSLKHELDACNAILTNPDIENPKEEYDAYHTKHVAPLLAQFGKKKRCKGELEEKKKTLQDKETSLHDQIESKLKPIRLYEDETSRIFGQINLLEERLGLRGDLIGATRFNDTPFKQLLYSNNRDISTLHQYLKDRIEAVWGEASKITTFGDKFNLALATLHSIATNLTYQPILNVSYGDLHLLSANQTKLANEFLQSASFVPFWPKAISESTVINILHTILFENFQITQILLLQLMGFQHVYDGQQSAPFQMHTRTLENSITNSPPTFINPIHVFKNQRFAPLSAELTDAMLDELAQVVTILFEHDYFTEMPSLYEHFLTTLTTRAPQSKSIPKLKAIAACIDKARISNQAVKQCRIENAQPILEQGALVYPDGIEHSQNNQLIYRDNADLQKLFQFLQTRIDTVWGEESKLLTIPTKIKVINETVETIFSHTQYTRLLKTNGTTNSQKHLDEEGLIDVTNAHNQLRNQFPTFWREEFDEKLVKNVLNQLNVNNRHIFHFLALKLLGFTISYDNCESKPFVLVARSFSNSVSNKHGPKFVKPTRKFPIFTVTPLLDLPDCVMDDYLFDAFSLIRSDLHPDDQWVLDAITNAFFTHYPRNLVECSVAGSK